MSIKANRLSVAFICAIIILSTVVVFSFLTKNTTANTQSYELNLNLSPSGSVSLGVNVAQNFAATVDNGAYPLIFEFKQQWYYENGTVGSIETLQTTIVTKGEKTASYNFNGFAQATLDYFVLTVQVTDANKVSHSGTWYVHDPFTNPKMVTDSASSASYTFKIETGGKGWYRAINGTDNSVTWTSTNVNYIFSQVTALNGAHIYVKTDGKPITWITNMIPANLTIESDNGKNFIIQSVNPDANYVACGANTEIKSFTVYDKYGLDIGYSPNSPRTVELFWNSQNRTLDKMPIWKNGIIVATIGSGGSSTKYDPNLDQPGLIIDNYGIGDNIFLSSAVNSMGNLIYLYQGSGSFTGNGIYANFGANGGDATTAYFMHLAKNGIDQLRINTNGALIFGPDTNPLVDLYYANGMLVSDTTIQAKGYSTIQKAAENKVFFTYVERDTNARFTINTNGGFAWGPGNGAPDVTLYRALSGLLMTNGAFQANSGYRASDGSTGMTGNININGTTLVIKNGLIVDTIP